MQPFCTTLGTEGRRPDGCHTPLCAAGAGPFGNTGKHRPADWYLSRDDSLSACTKILRFAQDDCCPVGLPDPRSRSSIPAAPRLRAPPQPSRQRRVKLKPLKNLRPSGPSTLNPAGLVHKRPLPPLTRSPSPIDGGGKCEGKKQRLGRCFFQSFSLSVFPRFR